MKIGEIERTHIVFYTKIHSLPFTFNDEEGMRDQSWQGQKWPCFSSRCIGIRRFTQSTNSGDNGCIFQRRSFWMIGGSRRLAMIVTRGGASSVNWTASSSRCPDGFVIPILHDFLYGVIRNLRSRASGKCVIVECSGT